MSKKVTPPRRYTNLIMVIISLVLGVNWVLSLVTIGALSALGPVNQAPLLRFGNFWSWPIFFSSYLLAPFIQIFNLTTTSKIITYLEFGLSILIASTLVYTILLLVKKIIKNNWGS